MNKLIYLNNIVKLFNKLLVIDLLVTFFSKLDKLIEFVS